MKNTGEYGFKVLRGFKTDKQYSPGESVTADEAKSIPIRSRIALSNMGKIEFFAEPSGADVLIERVAQLEAENETLKEKIKALEAEAESQKKKPATRGRKPKGAEL
jgi:hypothetical protein